MTRQKTLRALVASTFAVGALFTSFLIGSQPAMADPISDAQTQLNTLEQQRSAIEDKYNDSKNRLDAAQKQQDQLNSDIADQQAALDQLTPTIVWIVTMQRQTAGVNMTANFLLDDSEDSFLTQMSTMAMVTNTIDEQVARYVSEQQRLDDLKTSLNSTIATIQTEVKTQAKLLSDAKAKEDAQSRVLKRLTAAQQAALAARQAAASRTVSHSGSGSKSSGGSIIVDPGNASARAMTVVNYALKQKGKSYVYGAAGPNSFDCSGLTMAAYARVGISLPHSAHLQAKYGRAVSRNALVPGDLLFFYTPISHVGIYIGNGQMIHASTPATGVKISPVEASFNTARRLV